MTIRHLRTLAWLPLAAMTVACSTSSSSLVKTETVTAGED